MVNGKQTINVGLMDIVIPQICNPHADWIAGGAYSLLYRALLLNI